ncbi:RNA polymerase sigma factor [Chondrinema litorale]|uniref:RNA polymerase sigma factor n=1 Tax=Chondrinema litorale TaxID=2994555 RepID=UPI0025437A0F|nr:sigma-70 family RNA polymerase sigma factor [Chondrinema litorale]UZR93903.1 sigma-70 family RNA polymerase sigma factor [Chondrinema litorale]
MGSQQTDLQEELAIINQAKNNPEAFGLLYEKYYKEIFIYINKRIDNLSISSDLASQVFLKAMTHLPKYQFKGFPFSSWLYKIATNQVNQYFRNSKNQRVISIDDFYVNKIFSELEDRQDIKQKEQTPLLVQLLNMLDESELQILELRFFEEKAFKEVAYILDITENNAKVKTYRIIEKLKKIAKGMEPPEQHDIFSIMLFMLFLNEVLQTIPVTIL